MSNITKALDRINKIVDSMEYNYIKIEVESNDGQYTLEKSKHKTIGFKAGDASE